MSKVSKIVNEVQILYSWKQRFSKYKNKYSNKQKLTLSVSCEETVSDSCDGPGPDLESESDPAPFVFAHAL